MISYDIDGVLAENPPNRNKKFELQTNEERIQYDNLLKNWYANAKPLLFPKDEFIAISARKKSTEIIEITANWMNKYHKSLVHSIHLFDGKKTLDNVANFKAKCIQQNHITKHTEDNLDILFRLKKIVGNTVELYHWEKGMIEPKVF